MKKRHSFGKRAIFALLVTTLIGTLPGCPGGSPDEPILQSIAITSPPDKIVYARGEALNISGLIVTGTYSDGATRTESVSLSNISGYDADAVGTQTLTVMINGKTATFTVTVNNKSDPLAGLEGLANVPTGGGSVDNPIPLTLSGVLTSDSWQATLFTIAATNKYVALDLSACTMTATEFDPAASEGADKIVALILPDTAKSVKRDDALDGAFPALASISGAGVETIDGGAFFGCASLTTVSLPSVATIGSFAFSDCTSLTTVNLPSAATIGDGAFSGCTNLTTVSLPSAATISEETWFASVGTFSGCASLTTVNIPVATAIGDRMFSGCASLKEVSLPSATTIGDYAFLDCANLKEVSLPSLTAFGKVPFSGCTSLTTVNLPAAPPSIDVAPESSNPGWYNGIFSNTSSTDDTDAISVIVPAGAGLAYSSTWNVSAHSSANSRPYIYGSNHKAVIFPDMADDPANNGSGLAGLEALANAPAGGNTADNPIPLMLSGNLTTNGWKAVCYTVDAAGKYVTLDLSACTMTGDKFAPGTDAGVEKITALALPDTAKSIKTAEMAGASPFNAFTALTSISGAGVETVDNQAFNYCMSLTSVNLPAATTIGYSAFYECRNLAEVSLPVAATIGDWAFYGCTSLTEVSLPVATDIGTRAFYSCKNLTEVSLPVAAAIGGGAFYGCTSLTEVSLPVATAIGGEAFRYCTNLTTVSLPATPPSIGDYIFRYTSSMDTVTILVPAGAVSAYTSAWGVSANTTAGGNTNKYGAGHKAVLITDAAQ